MSNRQVSVSVSATGEGIEALHAEFDAYYKEWMSSHNIRGWVKRRQAEGLSPNACSDFGYGYQTVSDFDSVPWRWLTDQRVSEIDEQC